MVSSAIASTNHDFHVVEQCPPHWNGMLLALFILAILLTMTKTNRKDMIDEALRKQLLNVIFSQFGHISGVTRKTGSRDLLLLVLTLLLQLTNANISSSRQTVSYSSIHFLPILAVSYESWYRWTYKTCISFQVNES